MSLVTKNIGGKKYYYSFISYFLINKSKSFSKYIGLKKPTTRGLLKIEDSFKKELVTRISGKDYTNSLISKDEVIKSLLFSRLFQERYQKLTYFKRRKYDIDSTIRFALTTLTTEEVDVDLSDVENAFEKGTRLTQREQISKNMLNAIDLIKQDHKLDRKLLLELHKMIMATFETKNPGRFRQRQVHLYRKEEFSTSIGIEVDYKPPNYNKVEELLNRFFNWYNKSSLNPLEKAALAHYNLYKIHPFLDGNKRICRLIFNKTLLDNKFPLINISVSKEVYFDALVASVEKNEPKPFIDFAVNQYYNQIKEFLITKR